MFSNDDFIKYFLQLRKMELAMGERFGNSAGAVDDPALKKFFTDLQRQEKGHAAVVDDILSKFGYKTAGA